MPDTVPACEPDQCGECAPHEPHPIGDCMAGVINWAGFPDVCRCEGGE